MKLKDYFSLLFIICHITVNISQIQAKTIRIEIANPSSFVNKKDLQVTELVVSGLINKKTISTFFDLYPNIEALDLSKSKVVSFTNEKKEFYPANEIPSSAFKKQIKLKSVILPTGVTRIGMGAFWNCSGLENIVLPNSVKIIDRFAFQLCSHLKHITFPEDLVTLGGASFAGCDSLRTIKCCSKKPPLMPEWSPFADMELNVCTIFVPVKSVENYRNSKYFEIFQIKTYKL